MLALARLLIFLVPLLGVMLAEVAWQRADAGWLSRLARHADDGGSAGRVGKAVTNLDEVGTHLKTLPSSRRDRAIAVDVTNEGHWQLRNAAGETFTAATPDELRRGLQVLVPIPASDVARHVLILTVQALLHQAHAQKPLPVGSEFHALIDGQVLALVQRTTGGREQYYLDAGGGVHVPVISREQVHEVLWQLARPADLAGIRVLALEPGSITLLKRPPPARTDSARLAVEAVDPGRLMHMLGAVAGQTVVVTGRIEGSVLHFRPSSGPERTIALDDLRRAVAAHDINLAIIGSASARQPGTRNWFWQRVDLTRLDKPTKRTLADLVRQLTGGVAVEVHLRGTHAQRTSLSFSALAANGFHGWTAPVSDTWRDLAPEVTGTIVASGLDLDLTSRGHQKELDSRIVPGISSDVQAVFIVLWVLGIVGAGVAWRWWQRIWPSESRAEYRRRIGYWAARLVRIGVFLIMFMPLVAVISAPMALFEAVWHALQTIYYVVTYPFRRRRPA